MVGRAPTLAGYTVWPDPFGWAGLAPPAGVDDLRQATAGHIGGRFDESFTVYDQPLVMIFTKEQRLSRTALLDRFLLANGEPVSSLPDRQLNDEAQE